MVTAYRSKAARLLDNVTYGAMPPVGPGGLSSDNAGGPSLRTGTAPNEVASPGAQRGNNVRAVIARHLPRLFDCAAAGPIPRQLSELPSTLRERERGSGERGACEQD
jgi:hypothetical protein